VGTTEAHDYLRLLYSSIGTPHCPLCGNEISRQTTEQILQHVLGLRPGDRIMVLAPVVRGRKGEFKKDLEKLARQGFVRARELARISRREAAAVDLLQALQARLA
jgi:excinuclease ABC subunit A